MNGSILSTDGYLEDDKVEVDTQQQQQQSVTATEPLSDNKTKLDAVVTKDDQNAF